jgi:VWFA-related protein
MWYRGLNTGSTASFLAGFLFILSFATGLSQDPVLKTRPKENRDAQSNATHRITMNVQVTDSAGNPVSDLRAEDFTLYDNNQQRRIAAFRSIDGQALNDATQILMLLDAVNTPAAALEEEKTAIFKYLAEGHKPLSFPTAFALWFNGHLSATPATTDRNAIGRAFVKLTKTVHSNACGGGSDGAEQKVTINKKAETVDPATCRAVHFKDSISALDGIAQQQLSTGRRTLLIWMGSGWPTLSSTDLQRLTPKQQHDYAREFATITHDLRAAQITVYSLTPEKRNLNKDLAGNLGSTQASGSASTGHLPRLAVDEFAERTGGRAIGASSELIADLHRCIRDAKWYYMFSFNAPPAQSVTGEMHSLAVKVNRPGVEVRAMDRYYTEPR